MLYLNDPKWKADREGNNLKSFEELNEAQAKRENALLSCLIGEAEMAKLVNAAASGAVGRESLWVQLPLSALSFFY